MVISFGSGVGGRDGGHYHIPTEINDDDSSFMFENTLYHWHSDDRIKLTKTGIFYTPLAAGHIHKYIVTKNE